MTSEQREKLGLAKLALCEARPYLTTCVYALRTVEVEEPLVPGAPPTMATDKFYRLYVNPGIIDTLSVKQLIAVLYHECMHILRAHSDRLPARLNPMAWNIAADAEINDDIRAEGLEIPKESVFPENLKAPEKLSAEEYVAYMRQLPQSKDGSGIPMDLPGGQGGQGESKPKAGAGACGSAAHGHKQDYEKPGPGEEGGGDAVDEISGEMIRKKVAEEVQKHAKGRGSVPGHWSRWADDLIDPQVPWNRLLRNFVRKAIRDGQGASDYTYRRPGRRSQNRIIMPGMFSPKPSVAVVGDTSGSMSGGDLAVILAETKGLIRAVGGEVHFFAVDSEVHKQGRVRDAKKIQLQGGGGTDMSRGIEAALTVNPNVVVVITDCETPWGTPPKGVPIVVVAVGESGSVPSWAQEIRVKTGDLKR